MQSSQKPFAVKVALISLYFLAIFSFLSNSLNSLTHIAFFISGFFYLYFYRNQLRSFSLLTKVLASYTVIIIFSLLYNGLFSEMENFSRFLYKTRYFVLGLMSIFPITYLIESQKLSKHGPRLLSYFFLATNFASIVGIIALFTGYNIVRLKEACEVTRACGLYGQSITYGYGISMVLALQISLLFFYDKLPQIYRINKSFMYLSVLINFAGLYLSYSRGGLLALLTSLLAFGWFKHVKAFKVLSAILVLAVLSTIYISKNYNINNRYFLKLGAGTNLMRIVQAKVALKKSLEHLGIGIGLRHFGLHSSEWRKAYGISVGPYRDYENWNSHAHNNYLEILVGAGLLAFLLFCYWHFAWLKEALTSTHWQLNLFAPVVICIIVTGLFQSTIIDGENSLVIFSVFAFYEAIKRYLTYSNEASV